ncbi:hypothetical protein BC832DRAFT_265732 [Gaertneriomyces semiglobifer]|nr:hypothetical protein BC832DRAFT_265732 [Gaertneriomyces semiglobifer]
MTSSPRRCPTREEIISKRFSMKLNSEHVMWGTRSSEGPVGFDTLLNAKYSTFFLLADLHGGIDGNVWLASTDDGKGCVIKLLKDHKEEDASQEADLWAHIWKLKAHKKKLAGKPAVIMPYVRPCAGNSDAFEPPENLKAATLKAIDEMANLRLCHADLKWAHVATYKVADSEEEKVVFLDLTRVEKDVEPSAAKGGMMEKLGWKTERPVVCVAVG